MSSLSKLIGENVIKEEKGEVSLIESSRFEGSGKILGLYFSAHWCPPCRAFTPQLAEWYKNVKKSSNGDNFDIVFLSSDKNAEGFNEYFKEMPWYAVPYSDRDIKNRLSQKFKVTGIPTLVFVNAENGSVITTDGRSVVMEDPDGKEFPWTPKPVLELLSGNLLEKGGDTTWDVVQKSVDYVGVYFSAHWCGPCRTFTPQLVKTYNKVKEAGKKFEIIFCSSDRDEDSFKEYYSSMPWLALPYGDNRKKALSRVFDVSGIPTLVILDKDGKTVTCSGRAAVSYDLDGKDFPWHPKPVNLLSGMTVDEINDVPSIIWFVDGSEETLDTAKSSLETVAKKFKHDNPDFDLLFFYANAKEGQDSVAASLIQFADLPKKTPLLVIIDIPNRKKYVSETVSITEDTVHDMIKVFKSGELEGSGLKQ